MKRSLVNVVSTHGNEAMIGIYINQDAYALHIFFVDGDHRGRAVKNF